ncbi:MAG: branched-chain amino acid ABC transporter permease [Chloroflexi bacterium]|nr:branched-chain amino acid ABC transporter permease [Chloroflexota bacterium]
MFQAFIVQALVTGGVYALLAVGFSLIFGVARMVNLAHTSFLMLAAYWMFYCTYRLGLDIFLSIAIALVATVLIGLLSYKLFIDRVREHEVTVMLITLALATCFQEIMILAFGAEFREAPTLIPGYVEIIGVKVSYQHLLTIAVVAAVLLCMWLILAKTKLGIGIRATAQDTEVANLMGINVSRILLITMGLGSALAAIAGIVVAPLWVVYPYMWMSPLVMIMAIVVLGGLGSVKGSLIGAFIIGIVEAGVVFFLPGGSFLRGAIALLVMVIILVVRPEGLYGIVFEEERL